MYFMVTLLEDAFYTVALSHEKHCAYQGVIIL